MFMFVEAPLEQDKTTFESAEDTEVSSLNELDIIRADKRSPPTTEDEITFLFVNHFLDILLKWYVNDFVLLSFSLIILERERILKF